jgi:hypothetical protein
MLLAGCVVTALIATSQGPAAAPVAEGPRLEVLAGSARVLAGEGWRHVARGERLLDAPTECALRLEGDAHARLVGRGAALEIHGPLELVSQAEVPWKLSAAGRGRLRLEVRSEPVLLELESNAQLTLSRGVYWAEAVTGGGWRVGCDAGEPILLSPPEGLRWASRPRVGCGEVLRLVPVRFAGPESDLAGRPVRLRPWSGFSWPWHSVGGDARAQQHADEFRQVPGDEDRVHVKFAVGE